MTRLLLSVTLLLAALFAAAVLAVRAQPYDDGGLRAFLLAEDCALPCLMGMHPLATSTDEAVAALARHPWVDASSVIARKIIIGQDIDPEWHITWRWNGQQPPLLGSGGKAITLNNGLQAIRLLTDIPFGTLWLALGRPQIGGDSAPGLARHQAVYPAQRLTLHVTLPPGYNPMAFWRAPVEMRVEAVPEVGSQQLYRLPCWMGCG
jgi:hypothetical protein